MEKIEFIAAGGIRLDKLISENTELSRSAESLLIKRIVLRRGLLLK